MDQSTQVKVTLDQIWAASLDDLSAIIKSANQSPNEDIKINRAIVAIIYYNSGMIDHSQAHYVADPQFIHVCSTVDTVEDCISNLSHEDDVGTYNFNEGLTNHFNKLTIYYTILGDKPRAKTFRNAAAVVAETLYTITSAQQLPHIKGVGASTLEEITEYLASGTSKRLQALETSTKTKRDSMKELMSIHGIGQEKASELYAMGITNIQLLEASLAHNPKLLNNTQKKGFKWHIHMAERIPHSEVQMYEELIRKAWSNIDDLWMITGSYRRGESTSGDIDIIVRQEKTSTYQLVQLLQKAGLIAEILALGPKKFMGIIRVGDQYIGRQIDIRMFSPNEWAYGILYNTGSQRFNILMRIVANELGLTLNEYTMQSLDGNYKYPADTEGDVFKTLGLKYLEPVERTRDLASIPKL